MVVAFIKGTRMITKAEAVIDLPTGSSDSCDSGHRPIKMKLGQQKVQDVQLHMYILSSTEGMPVTRGGSRGSDEPPLKTNPLSNPNHPQWRNCLSAHKHCAYLLAPKFLKMTIENTSVPPITCV